LSPGGRTTTTNSSGVYSLTNLAAGTYTLTVSAPLYQTSSQTVTVAAGQTLTVNVRLLNLLGL